MQDSVWLLLSIYILLNVYTFLLMRRDKALARKKRWRIPEARFFTLALLGGALGIWFGMRVFHHKTKHKQFVYGIPLAFLIHWVVIYTLWTRLIL